MALEGAVEQARSLEVAQHKASMYSPLSFSVFHSTTVSVTDPRVANDSEEVIASAKITAATKTIVDVPYILATLVQLGTLHATSVRRKTTLLVFVSLWDSELSGTSLVLQRR